MARDRVKDADKGKKKELEKPKEKPKEQPKKVERVRQLVRVMNTDLDGDKSLIWALRGIKGVGFVMSKAICNASRFDPNVKSGSLSESDIQKLEQVIHEPMKFGVPAFMVNRRFDLETGKDLHLTGQDFDVAMKFDIRREVDSKSYRGWRHMLGQPVRGQKTRSHFRQKGRVVGVMRKAIKLQMQKPEEVKKEEKKAEK